MREIIEKLVLVDNNQQSGGTARVFSKSAAELRGVLTNQIVMLTRGHL
jgi:hypothetical protein